MARIQVLPLPAEKVGDMSTNPFVIIIDQADPDQFNDWPKSSVDEIGARTVLVTEHTLDVV